MKGGLGSLLALGYLASVLRHNSRHSSQSEASCPPGPWSPRLQRRSGSSTRLQRLALPCSGSSRGRRCGSRTPHPEAGRQAGGGGVGWVGECGNCGTRRPGGPRPPETRHQHPGCLALQALRTRDCLPATTGERQWRKEGGEPAAISHRSLEQPGGPSLGPNPAQPAARLKT